MPTDPDPVRALPHTWRTRMDEGWRGRQADRVWRICADELEAALEAATLAPRPPDVYPWGETMSQYATLGIGAEAWVELQQIEQAGTKRRNTDKCGVSVSWGTFRLVMTVLRAIRIHDFCAAARPAPPYTREEFERDQKGETGDRLATRPAPQEGAEK